MKGYVAVTDEAWFRYLADRPQLTEANFWLPNPPEKFGAIDPAEPLFFKTHHPSNQLVGGGWLSDYRRLPLSLAWQTFGESNGCGSLSEMRSAISKYRGGIAADEDPVIGCVMLRDTAFFPAGTEIPAPPDFAKNIVRGKGYQLGAAPPEVEAALARLAVMAPDGPPAVDMVWQVPGPTRGAARLVVPRLGQHAFAAAVSDAYALRCAVTGDKVRPVLQAAHIRPVAYDWQHRIDNGLLLRADVHIVFDQGYLGVEPRTRKLLVSKDIREVFGVDQLVKSCARGRQQLAASCGDRLPMCCAS